MKLIKLKASLLPLGAIVAIILLGIIILIVIMTSSEMSMPQATPTATSTQTLGPTATGIGYPTPTATGIGYPTPTATGIGYPTPTATGIGYPTPTATGIGYPTPTTTGIGYPTPTATPDINVWIDALDEVSAGGNFSAWVNVSVGALHLAGATYDIAYNSSVMNVTSVDTIGIVGGEPFPNSSVHSWSFISQGEIRINQAMKAGYGYGISWVSGSGYIAIVYFHVNGSTCDDSAIEFNEAGLFKSDSTKIPANWISDSVHVR